MAYYGPASARLYRDRRWQNIWLVGCGPALALSGELYASYSEWIGLVEGVHDQMLRCLMFQSGLEQSDLVKA